MLEKVKLALRITSDLFDSEIEDMINAGIADLGIAGITAETTEPLIIRAIITYCQIYFQDKLELKPSYDEQKAQLSMATGFTDWGDDSAE